MPGATCIESVLDAAIIIRVLIREWAIDRGVFVGIRSISTGVTYRIGRFVKLFESRESLS